MLKLAKAKISEKRKDESLLSMEIILTTSCEQVEDYFVNSLTMFRPSNKHS